MAAANSHTAIITNITRLKFILDSFLPLLMRLGPLLNCFNDYSSSQGGGAATLPPKPFNVLLRTLDFVHNISFFPYPWEQGNKGLKPLYSAAFIKNDQI